MIGVAVLLATAGVCQPGPRPAPVADRVDSVAFGRFGSVALYGDPANATQVVLFVSGDGGWNLGVVGMARHLASLGALVVGIDIRRYLASVRADSTSCVSPAVDFEALSQFVQQRLGLARYHPPILAGYSSGATLVYAVLAEGPPGTFRGAISLGFCPDLPLRRKLCPGSGLTQARLPRGAGVQFGPAPQLSAPWVVLHGALDQVCDPDSTGAFVRRVGGAEFVLLAKVGHGFGVEANWLAAFQRGFARIAGDSADEPRVTDPAVADLPLVMVPATAGAAHPGSVAVMVSGDGGWAGLDRGVADGLATAGVPVVGFNSLQYFWRARTPDRFAADLARVIEHALATSGADRVLLIGYSFGADVLPFAVNRLSPAFQGRVEAVVLIGASDRASFEFHVGSWIGQASRTALPTLPEVEQLRSRVPGARLVCVAGSDETDSACHANAKAGFQAVVIPGGHHLGGDYRRLAEIVLGRAGSSP